ncbi:MAG: LD-carboxypeptidase [Sphingobacteriales bacterium]|nr:MAG: LD-carboxypeptidase [Sphingobacteriales bacterium]
MKLDSVLEDFTILTIYGDARANACENVDKLLPLIENEGELLEINLPKNTPVTCGKNSHEYELAINLLRAENIKAILCARGGYGTSRIIDRLNFRKFKKNPKWIIGFSDVTVLHAHINRRIKTATLHAPMAAAFNDDGYMNEYVLSLKNAMEGKPNIYQSVPHTFNNIGRAVGELVGGNLALIVHLIGTPSGLKTKGKILFLEDIGEQLYSVDRMFVQLKRSGKLDDLAGLIIGGFTDMKDTDRPFGKTINELIHDHLKDYKYPVCFGFPVSHDKENYALKIGVGYKLKVGKVKVSLEELT